MLLIISAVGSLDSIINRWEWVEYIAEAFVVAGCVGEYVAEFTRVRTESWRHKLSRLSLIVMTMALALELTALFRTNIVSSKEIALLNDVATENQRLTALANERASSNERESARLNKEAEAEKTSRLRLEESVAWRRLTKTQQSEIAVNLRSFTGCVVNIFSSGGDFEAASFVSDISAALRKATWTVSTGGPVMIVFNNATGGPSVGVPIVAHGTGVTIQSTPDKTSRVCADAAAKELEVHGFDATRPPEPERISVEPRVTIHVETRPQGPQGAAGSR